MKKVPFLSNDDIENRVANRLIDAGMMPTVQNPILDLETFIQGPLNAVLDEYAELPAGIMGEVVFEPGCKDHVKVNRDLSELADSGVDETAITAQARRRSTTAHEVGHIVLHRDILMPAIGQTKLFDTADHASTATAYRCNKSDFGSIKITSSPRPSMRSEGEILSRDVDYLEIQANKAMASLLLPRGVFCAIALEPLQHWESRRGCCDDYLHFRERRRIIQELTEYFVVSRQVVEIRIKTLNLTSQSQQPALF